MSWTLTRVPPYRRSPDRRGFLVWYTTSAGTEVLLVGWWKLAHAMGEKPR